MADQPSYWLTRFLFLRLLGLVYTVAFLVTLNQWPPLLGSRGLLPAREFLDAVGAQHGRSLSTFLSVPTLFWLDASDGVFRAAGLAGLVLSLAVLLGFANVPMMLALWALYLSFVNAGQIFYGYGWEMLLLVTGLLRWLTFRLMFGAGLIKLRGDPCWRDLTCLFFHYETQPNPNPLSWYLHQLPPWFHRLEVLFNHGVELVAPFFVFGPQRARHLSGGLVVVFQGLLILSGNLSFLNWLTIAIAVACFDDGLLARLLPAGARARFGARIASLEETKARGVACYALAAVVGLLSVNPVLNMLSPRQLMNTSFDPFGLVNTYGAFGSVGRERYEIVLEGTDAPSPQGDEDWRAYEFRCKPGDPERRPCWISPYHHRLDWQMWFAAMPGAGTERWLVRLVAKLLEGDPAVRALLAPGVFEDHPPRLIRARYYRYAFTRPGEGAAWWRRTLVGEYLPPLSRRDVAELK